MNHKRKKYIAVKLLIVLMAINYGCVKETIRSDPYQMKRIQAQASGNITEAEIMSAVAQIDLMTFRGYHKFKAVIFLKKPSYIRAEILSPLGIPEYYLVARPDVMRVFIPSQGKYYQGKPTVENFSRFLSLPFSLEDVVTILSGSFPFINGEISYKEHKESDKVLVEILSKNKGIQVVEIGNGDRLYKFTQKDGFGQEIYNVQYGDYGKDNSMPGSVIVNLNDGVTFMRVKYQDMKIEENIDLSIFDLQIPEEIKTIIIE